MSSFFVGLSSATILNIATVYSVAISVCLPIFSSNIIQPFKLLDLSFYFSYYLHPLTVTDQLERCFERSDIAITLSLLALLSWGSCLSIDICGANQWVYPISSVQFSRSVMGPHVTLCDPMNCSMPGLPVHHQLLESTQTHVNWVGDAIQPSHPLSSPSPPAPNPSQHQGLFQWVNSSHQVAKVLEFQLQHQSFQWTPKADLL